MKIICENQEEYNQLKEVLNYLKDFRYKVYHQSNSYYLAGIDVEIDRKIKKLFDSESNIIIEFSIEDKIKYQFELRWIGQYVDFKKDNIEIRNCKVIDYDIELKSFKIDKVEGYIPIEYLYWNGTNLECLY